MSDFYCTSTPVARKNYCCEQCPATIFKGTKHVKISGVVDGDFGSYRSHIECQDAIQDVYSNMKLDDYDEYYHLHDYVSENFGPMIDWLFKNHPVVANRFIEQKIKFNQNKSPGVSIMETD